MSTLSVHSETGRLRAVAIHSPGKEVDHMTPALMHQLLFDDILFGPEARQEHAVFRKILERVADEVNDVQDLLAESLLQAGAQTHFLDRFCAFHRLTPSRREEMQSWDSKLLADRAVTGWYEELAEGSDYRFHFPPVPNLLFMRDPAAVIGSGVSLNNMASKTRGPESFLMNAIFRFHPHYKVDDEERIWFNAIPSYLKGYPETRHTIEGGDILVLSKDVLAVGISIRTSQSAVTLLAERLRRFGGFKTVFAVLMPQERAVMHLDTIFTQIDQEHCLIFPPYFTADSPQALSTIKIDLTAKHLQMVLKESFLDALAEEGLPLKPVYCGGANRLHQEREQWTDGANAFCLAPGVILGYSRNTATAEELARIGYTLIEAEEVLRRDLDVLDGNRYLILIKGNELSRARGGPRCMTLPLRRDNHSSPLG